jgi:hypothetical protein
MTYQARLISADYSLILDIAVSGPSTLDPKPWYWSVRKREGFAVSSGCGPRSSGYADTRSEAIALAYAFAAARVDLEMIKAADPAYT